MFNRVLIANRGEIACRIIETCNNLGLTSIAIYSDSDKDALHVKKADQAYYVGPSPVKESYLNQDKIIQIAKECRADAIHPGYGFFSENADFAKICAQNEIEFIGPPVDAIIAMGSKSAAKAIMENAGVPLVQGYHGENQQPEFLLEQAINIGFPVLIKATAGGGGKGMRVVETQEQFLTSLDACKRESLSSFGDDKVLIENYLTRPRHVEIQIFTDKMGNGVYLHERDCSLQRRHQKVIEEAPAPALTQKVRTELGEVALKAAKAIGYVGAGTVEFLYDVDQSFYFMEMNTRLQVEHPVTEMITGVDLVEWQLRIASGQPLPLQQHQIPLNGHSFEVRLYAEDPDNDFLPATGDIVHLQFPETSAHTRIDTGIEEGNSISIFYDPMIAKIIVHDHDRNAALKRMKNALLDTRIIGLKTNISFLQAIVNNEAFKNLDLDTHFIERKKEELFSSNDEFDADAIALMGLFLIKKAQKYQPFESKNRKISSPWDEVNFFRLNSDSEYKFEFINEQLENNNHFQLSVSMDSNLYTMTIFQDEKIVKTVSIQGEVSERHNITAQLNQNRVTAQAYQFQQDLHLYYHDNHYQLHYIDQNVFETDQDDENNLTAPMPGSIIEIKVAAGEKVKEGDVLLIMEAMKMEHSIIAPFDGTIEDIFYQQGEQVSEGDELVTLLQQS